jgi:hypothetical protein
VRRDRSRRWIVALLLIILIAATFVARTARPASRTGDAATHRADLTTHTSVPATHKATVPPLTPTHTPLMATHTPLMATHTPAAPAPTAVPPTHTPLPAPTTIPVPRVGLQVGHWRSDELPQELARLRSNTGTAAGGVREVDVNLDVARRVADLLIARGIEVDLLPATVPPRYRADAFVAIHADGGTSAASRGFKLATPWRTSGASQHLHDAIIAEYAAATGLPQDGAITFNMRGYYAFSGRRYVHAIDRLTPAVIVEMGFLTNAADRALLTSDPDRVARGIAAGLMRYLEERDPADRAALVPPNLSVLEVSARGAEIHAAPGRDSRVLFSAHPAESLIPFQRRGDWYEVVVRGRWSVVGWVHAADVRPSASLLPSD